MRRLKSGPLLAVPGAPEPKTAVTLCVEWQRGPMEFATKQAADETFWSAVENWPLTDSSGIGRLEPLTFVHWPAVISNVLIAFGMLILSGCALELRHRHRKSAWQISLADLFAAFLVVGLACGWYASASNELRSEWKLREKLLEGAVSRFSVEDTTPLWVSRLADNSRLLSVKLSEDSEAALPIGTRIVAIEFYNQMNFIRDVEEYAANLSELKHLRKISHWQGSKRSFQVLSHVEPQNIRELHFLNSGIKDYRCVSRFRNVEVLCFRGIDLAEVAFDFPVLPKLREIEIEDIYFSSKVYEWLRRQPSLEVLTVWGIGDFDDAFRAQLKHELPDLQIQDRFSNLIR